MLCFSSTSYRFDVAFGSFVGRCLFHTYLDQTFDRTLFKKVKGDILGPSTGVSVSFSFCASIMMKMGLCLIQNLNLFKDSTSKQSHTMIKVENKYLIVLITFSSSLSPVE